MEISRLSDLRPRTVWDVIDDAFDLYRENFALFAGIVALVMVPVQLVYIPWVSRALRPILASRGGVEDSQAFLNALSGIGAAAIPLLGIAYLLYAGAATVATEDYLAGRPTGILPAYRRALPRFWTLLGIGVVVGLLMFLGFFATTIAFTFTIVAFVSPIALPLKLLTLLGPLVTTAGTICVLAFYAFAPQAAVQERCGVLAAGRRSGELVRGQAGRVIGLFAALWLLSALLSLGLTGLIELIFWLLPGRTGGDIAAQEMRTVVFSQVAQALGNVLIAPIVPLSLTLLYYDARVRREGLDMEAQAVAIGYPLAPDPFAGGAKPATVLPGSSVR